MAEAELKTLRDQQAVEARQLKARVEKLKAQEAAVADRDAKVKKAALELAAERDCLTKLKEEAEAAQAALAEAKKMAAVERSTLTPSRHVSTRPRRRSLDMIPSRRWW